MDLNPKEAVAIIPDLKKSLSSDQLYIFTFFSMFSRVGTVMKPWSVTETTQHIQGQIDEEVEMAGSINIVEIHSKFAPLQGTEDVQINHFSFQTSDYENKRMKSKLRLKAYLGIWQLCVEK